MTGARQRHRTACVAVGLIAMIVLVCPAMASPFNKQSDTFKSSTGAFVEKVSYSEAFANMPKQLRQANFQQDYSKTVGQFQSRSGPSYGQQQPLQSMHGTEKLMQYQPVKAPPALMDLMMNLLNYTRSAYCIDGLDTWTCTTCGGATEHTTNITLIGNPTFTSFCYTAVHIPTSRIIVSFRGSQNLDNWVKDITTALPDSPFPESPPGAQVHLGFLQAWNQIRTEVLDQVKLLASSFPDFDIIVTGHSLGGALTTMASMEMVTLLGLDPQRILLYTINQPRTGNFEFVQWVASVNFKAILRVVNQNDVTPHLPPLFLGFFHHPTEIWVSNRDGTTYVCPATEDMTALKNSKSKVVTKLDEEDDLPVESQDCANSLTFGLDVLKHIWIWDIPIGRHAC
ncbi:hypothetical protein BATDEDRAFT_91518 [Batrachochytrium dendrobatidis JAM81]|uniref:Fungal lipase-type domain-containing protein n=2 Tax=Batrachochytrium dendrobatidis TaxID=109871 RepID=F4PAJ2_BATDJ|nr:uncharacterized protein BATDEDRAFT_91518 [Batrachochytrium dendrobatidis JAM81]EGF77696.1 hypothetical protein BATDEDRAFT_91518 [Batrachochytrium dendrobatidis JAM81]|eukprot:XP_006681805.1 hypothetical protein BATDEDRAFT_91518 [Batrachochytrium dendrobatidis JAM81]